LHDTIDSLCGYPVDFITDYDSEGLRLSKYMTRVVKDLMSLSPDLSSVLATQVSEKLTSDYNCAPEIAPDLAAHFLIRRKDVQSYLSSLILSDFRLASFNWSLSLVLSSSVKADMKEPLLHLQLTTTQDNLPQHSVLEFNHEELQRFLDKLTEIRDHCLGY
jgi:hypothetical protein